MKINGNDPLHVYEINTYTDGSYPIDRISCSLLIPIMKTVRSDSYQCHLLNFVLLLYLKF